MARANEECTLEPCYQLGKNNLLIIHDYTAARTCNHFIGDYRPLFIFSLLSFLPRP